MVIAIKRTNFIISNERKFLLITFNSNAFYNADFALIKDNIMQIFRVLSVTLYIFDISFHCFENTLATLAKTNEMIKPFTIKIYCTLSYLLLYSLILLKNYFSNRHKLRVIKFVFHDYVW